MKFIRSIFLIIFILTTYTSKAQFYSAGDDPASVKWNKISTAHYSIIYPRGLDSLAKIYGEGLEKYRIPVSRSVGYIPGEYTRGKIPVVLHSYNAIANGSVAWAPKRMDLFTNPTAYAPEPMSWVQMLAIHESRHVAQMQFGLSYALRPFNWFFGEMINGAFAGLYPRSYFLEGDAVVTETALSNSGRGRSGTFLNRYMISFDNGDFRTWRRWRLGSYRYYTPNHYALGYMQISGLRYFYDAVDYSESLLKHTAKKPLDIFYFQKSSRKYTGKNHRDSFDDIMRSYHQMWNEEIAARKPFIEKELVSPYPKTHTEYSGLTIINSDLYAIRESFNKSSSLIRIDSTGREHYISPFSLETGSFRYSPMYNGLFWSETIGDKRWTQAANSHIRFYNFKTKRKETITKAGFFYNPSPSFKKQDILVTEYTLDNRTAITILSELNGKANNRFFAPMGVQFIQAARIGSNIYALGLTEEGYGVWELSDSKKPIWKEIIAPSPVLIRDFMTKGEELYFTSDRTGVNELYHYNPRTKVFTQKTSTRYGATNFNYGEDGYLYYCAPDLLGTAVYKSPIASLLNKEVDFFDRHRYKIADKLSEQEAELAMQDNRDSATVISFSEPKEYKKWLNIPNFHSWAPLYFDIDNVKSLSFDNFDYESVALGLTAISQNRLGTASGQLGYSAHPDPYNKNSWRNSGHFKLKYSGLFPVFELSLDVNDRSSIQYNQHSTLISSSQKMTS